MEAPFSVVSSQTTAAHSSDFGRICPTTVAARVRLGAPHWLTRSAIPAKPRRGARTQAPDLPLDVHDRLCTPDTGRTPVETDTTRQNMKHKGIEIFNEEPFRKDLALLRGALSANVISLA